LQRQLTESVLAEKPEAPLAAAFLARHDPLLEQVRSLEARITASDGPSALSGAAC
jgi:hypothetical protein